MFLAVLELLASTLVGYIVVTQVLYPYVQGTLLFPAFRKRRKLEQQIAEAKEVLDEVKIEKTVAEVKTQIEKEKNT